MQEELENAIRRHSELYYKLQPEISDKEFDALIEELHRVAPDSPVLREMGFSGQGPSTG